MKAQTSKEKFRALEDNKLHKWPQSRIPIISAIQLLNQIASLLLGCMTYTCPS